MNRRARCDECGYEAPRGTDEWSSVDHPSLGSLTACPECDSTRVHTLTERP